MTVGSTGSTPTTSKPNTTAKVDPPAATANTATADKPAAGAVIADVKPQDTSDVKGLIPDAKTVDTSHILPIDPLDQQIKIAQKEKVARDGDVDKLEAAFRKDLDALKALTKDLKFGGGGDVEKLGADRGVRFNNEFGTIGKLLDTRPLQALRVAERLRYMKVMLSPAATPIGPDGQGRPQRFWGLPVPGADKALAAITKLLGSAGTRGKEDPKTLWGASFQAQRAEVKVKDLKYIQHDKSEDGVNLAGGLNHGLADIRKLESELAAQKKVSTAATSAFTTERGVLFKAFDAKMMNESSPGDPKAVPSLREILAKDKTSLGKEAMENLLSAENSLKTGHFGAASEFLKRLDKNLADLPGSPALDGFRKGGAIGQLTKEITHATQTWQTHHTEHHKLLMLEQKVAATMQGFEDAVRAIPRTPVHTWASSANIAA